MALSVLEQLIASSRALERGFGQQFIEAAITSLQDVGVSWDSLVSSWDDFSVEAQVVILWFLGGNRTERDFPWEILFRALSSPDARVGGMAAGAFSRRGTPIEIDRLAVMFGNEPHVGIRATILCALRDAGDRVAARHKAVKLLEIAESASLSPREQAYMVEGLAYAMQHLDKNSPENVSAIRFLCETVLNGPWSEEARDELEFVVTVTEDAQLREEIKRYRKKTNRLLEQHVHSDRIDANNAN